MHIIDGTIRERKEIPRASAGAEDEDLLDVLLRLQEEDSRTFPLTAEIIGAVIFDIFGAATETTATALEWAMAELIRNPQAMARAKLEIRQKLGQGRVTITGEDLRDVHYLWMVINETLRLHPAAPFIARMSQENCQIMGYDIPKGSTVSNSFAIARDPRYWEDPDKFRPERFEDSNVGVHFEFIPFGAGRTMCSGALFATTSVRVTLANLLYRFDWELPNGASPETLDMREKFGFSLRRRSDFYAPAASRSLQ
ncbi:ent-isokaurene C2/C3-hydroxylase-like [Phragmites australis]|uniref:ent-isokaurene C2/C3-hydroxylase-like n=1 Tax=Phragmites australis TaxID=29695 RepID=UPI002D789079|nr:ent-isokaurene C2/C3-hydroxylase-like [Phragmites australis]